MLWPMGPMGTNGFPFAANLGEEATTIHIHSCMEGGTPNQREFRGENIIDCVVVVDDDIV